MVPALMELMEKRGDRQINEQKQFQKKVTLGIPHLGPSTEKMG